MHKYLLLLFILISGCASHRQVRPIWFRNAPEGWTAPQKYAHCKVRDEVVLVNGNPNGLDTIRLECPEQTVLLDKKTKKLIWRHYWPH